MRLFWALTPPPDIVGAIEADVAPLRVRWPDLRWTAPQAWHLTLVFLGQVDPAAVDPLLSAVRRALKGTRAVEVALAATAGTPGGRAGVVWIPAVASAPLRDLAERVRDAGDPVVAADRRHAFTGHLTLARIPRRDRGAGRQAADVAAGYGGRTHRWTAQHVSLLSSHPSPGGSVYRPQARIDLTNT